jgi:hypothetical protein
VTNAFSIARFADVTRMNFLKEPNYFIRHLGSRQSHLAAEIERQLWGKNPTDFLLFAERPLTAHLARCRAFRRSSPF